ncbi:MAG: hypothetical protein IJZ44_01850 [Lachnospiraceae bacterium]|nr:hypothetical protein [Lachnospiraceae bacterium]
MAVYKDFSEYELDNIKLHNVINIGWLGEAGCFPQGNVSDEFLMNLWEYYKCPIFSTRKIYQNEKLDGYWKFFVAIFNGREIGLGSSEVRVLDKERGVVYASPNLIIHYIVNHNYCPPQEYIKAVIEGPKPNSKDYCNMISSAYKDVKKREGENGVCPFCNSKCAGFAYKEKRQCLNPQKLLIIESSKIKKMKSDMDDYVYYFMCKDCGHLYEYDLASLVHDL